MVVNQNNPLKDYATPYQEDPYSSITPPTIEANNFELKPALLQIVQQNQLSGNPIEDPNLHLSVFVQYTNTLKANGINPKIIQLHFSPFL